MFSAIRSLCVDFGITKPPFWIYTKTFNKKRTINTFIIERTKFSKSICMQLVYRVAQNNLRRCFIVTLCNQLYVWIKQCNLLAICFVWATQRTIIESIQFNSHLFKCQTHNNYMHWANKMHK